MKLQVVLGHIPSVAQGIPDHVPQSNLVWKNIFLISLIIAQNLCLIIW